MLIDYKISNVSHEGQHTKARVRIFRGGFTDINNFDGATTNQYVRAALLRDRMFEFDLPTQLTIAETLVKVAFIFNKRLQDWATLNGHTIITEEQDISGYEAPLNETEYAST